MKQNFQIGIFITLLIFTTLAFSEDPPPADKVPDFKVGDTWEYSLKHPVKCTRWEGHGVKDGYLVGQCENYLLYATTDNGNWIKITDLDGKTIAEFKPYIPAIKYPITLGKSWEGQYSGYVKTQQYPDWNSSYKAKVVAYEEVSVPYGAYMAYKIEFEDHWQSGGYSGVNKGAYWVSPELKWWLKLENKGDPRWNYELINVQLQ